MEITANITNNIVYTKQVFWERMYISDCKNNFNYIVFGVGGHITVIGARTTAGLIAVLYNF